MCIELLCILEKEMDSFSPIHEHLLSFLKKWIIFYKHEILPFYCTISLLLLTPFTGILERISQANIKKFFLERSISVIHADMDLIESLEISYWISRFYFYWWKHSNDTICKILSKYYGQFFVTVEKWSVAILDFNSNY